MAFITLWLLFLLILIVWTLLFVHLLLFFHLQDQPLVRELVPPRQRQNHCSMLWGFVNFEPRGIDPDSATDRAENYLRRVVALTKATKTDDVYLLAVGTTQFHVRDRYVTRVRGAGDAKRAYEQTCYFCPNRRMPTAEQIATVLLMLKNNPALFDRWAAQHGLAFKADGANFILER